MSDLTKTIVSVAIALVLVGLVYATRPTALSSDRLSDVGEVFFPEFRDPLEATVLEVKAYDEQSASIVPFKVELLDGRWVIPSHHNYPADAEQNMARAASAFIELRKEIVVSDLPSDHQQLGVLAPGNPQAPLSGRGTRVTLSAADGRVLSDLIIGGEAKDLNVSGGPRKYYVRMPEKNRVYAATFASTFSTEFKDWVQTDLLELTGKTIDRIVIDRYSIDEAAGQKIPEERMVLTRSEPYDAQNPWRFESSAGELAEEETVNSARVGAIVTALRRLKIAGVRPKSTRLAQFFAGQSNGVTQVDILDLQSRGFFITPQGNFAANAGELRFSVGDGVFYTLYLGEVVFGSGRALSAGAPLGETDQAHGPIEQAESTGERRYAFVRVGFDPSFVPEPDPPVPGEDGTIDEFAQQAYEQARSQRTEKLEAGRVDVARLARRFADWYYVLDSDSFQQLRPGHADLVSDPASEGEAPPSTLMPPSGG